ncbi:peptidase [Streptomonospora alba]|uniref:Peptidase n=1 Tax=Streptomonospora alba TaxID=183763 RepID=A0A0C2JGQ5_9ACTN|nr:alpha/beta fold hydrolase [Streptomonospora alba]KIH98085.1 peptidase [Streptomonospora alba]
MTVRATSVPRRFEAEDLFRDPAFSHPVISPDGAWLAYLAPAGGRKNVWVRGIDQEQEEARCVTHDSRRGILTFFWCDDPRWLLYLQDTDGNEDWHLFRVDLEHPEAAPQDLTPLEPGSRVFSAEPMPSRPGTVLATMNQRPARLDMFLIDVGSGEITLLHEQTEAGVDLLLDRDGEPAFVSRVTEDGSTEFCTIDPDSGQQRLLLRAGGAEQPIGVEVQRSTPDGTGLILSLYLEGDDLQLVRIDRETAEVSVLAAVPGRSLDIMSVLAPGVLPPTLFTDRATGEILAARFTGPRPHIEVVDPRFAEVHAALAALSDGVLDSLSSDTSGTRWVATFLHDREPEAWLYNHATGRSRRLFQPYQHLDTAHLAPMEPVRLLARDGLPLHGYLTLPVGIPARKLPLALVVHGGPWAHDSWGFSAQVQFLADRGHAVLQVNFRGSSGYGRRHTLAARGEFAGAMHTDLLDAVDWAVDRGIADPDRVGIIGGSYGGYAALVGAAFTPERFAAAVDLVGIADLSSFLRSFPPVSRPYIASGWLAYVGDPDDPAQEADMLARSPMSRVDAITTPLLIAHGANDARVRREESDRIVTSLRDRGVPVEYLLGQDEGHGFGNPENEIRLQRAIAAHLAQHLA